MKKIIYIVLLSTIGTTPLHAQGDPGFGDEGGGDGQDAPVTPINELIIPLLITGILTSIYFIKKRESQLK
ncbi:MULTISPECIES: hypothetical protein [unclassified Flavobacterium]|uniref:hypothetical protein n=1 Tax=unclassified Flavobacterium TaxID=196869 RepID=UPI0012917744|nr:MULTISPECIES: hypothetical protein [unclassified Flavobacterium]MQP52087.1 hypothetical protein [Flavobacterium sp. LMO9]MQP61956.1 hypothetical protein [Flavobacterium sp. LMO6]